MIGWNDTDRLLPTTPNSPSVRLLHTLLTPHSVWWEQRISGTTARSGRLSLTHPFFPTPCPLPLTLPSGWSSASPSLRFTNYNRIVTVSSGAELPMTICADRVIPTDDVPFFYFEIRIEDIGQNSRVVVGLWPNDPFLDCHTLPGRPHGYGL